jgi:hypothetical protein
MKNHTGYICLKFLRFLWILFCSKRCLRGCFTQHFFSGRIFSHFPATLAGNIRNNLATVSIAGISRRNFILLVASSFNPGRIPFLRYGLLVQKLVNPSGILFLLRISYLGARNSQRINHSSGVPHFLRQTALLCEGTKNPPDFFVTRSSIPKCSLQRKTTFFELKLENFIIIEDNYDMVLLCTL